MAKRTVHLSLTPETFDEVYHALAPICRRLLSRDVYARALRWHFSGADYADMVANAINDAFDIALRTRDRFDPDKGTLLRWIMVIARRRLQHAMDYNHRHLSRRESLDACDTPVPCFTDRTLQRVQVDQTLARLHERHAQVLQAHYLMSRPVRAIAQDMAVTDTVVQSLLQRGRGRFKDLWLQFETEPSDIRKECSP